MRTDVQAWVTTLSRHLAPSTVGVVYSFLATIFKSAMADGVVASSPCRGIKLPEVAASRVIPMTPTDVRAISEAMPERYRAWVLVGAMTGLRFGELAGLTIDRVNFIRRVITVDRQWNGADFGPPKTVSSLRVIPLGELALGAMAGHLNAFPALEPEGFVFHTGRAPLSRSRGNEIWRKAVADLGIGRRVTPHDLRHFYASALIRQGADVKQVQQRLGHKSGQTTIDIYGHLWPDSDDRTRAAIDAMFDGSATEAGSKAAPDTGAG